MPQRPLSNSEKYVSSQHSMAVARINLKNIDYFKFKKLVIDGNRDDYTSCSKEVQALCDCVQTLKFRDEEFDDESDRMRFAEICIYYKQILNSKRIESLDMRIKSGWWGDHKNAYSAGKIKPAALKDLLISKAKAWTSRYGPQSLISSIQEKIDGPGLYVIKHKEHGCFQYVGRADRIFARVGEKLKAAFEGCITEPLAALLIMTMSSDWDFYFIPVDVEDDERVLRVMENDLILKHDCIWPHGLNFQLHIDSLLEVSEFRKSCLRHQWPPEAEVTDAEICLDRLRRQIEIQDEGIMPMPPEPTVDTPKKTKRRSAEERPPWEGIVDTAPTAPSTNGNRKAKCEAFIIPAFESEPLERPDSPKSDYSSSTFVVAPSNVVPPGSLNHTHPPSATASPKSPTKQASSRPTTPAKRAQQRSAGLRPLQGQISKKKQVSTPRSDGVDRVSSTPSLINSSNDQSPAKGRPKVKEKDTNTPVSTPRKRSPASLSPDDINKGEKHEKEGFEIDSLERSSPTPSNSSGCTYSVESSMERTHSSASLNSTSDSKENEKQEKQLKKKPTTAVRKRESVAQSPRKTRPTSAGRSTAKGKPTDGKVQSRLPVVASGGGAPQSPSHR